jgi:hypothetical protein
MPGEPEKCSTQTLRWARLCLMGPQAPLGTPSVITRSMGSLARGTDTSEMGTLSPSMAAMIRTTRSS